MYLEISDLITQGPAILISSKSGEPSVISHHIVKYSDEAT